MSDDKWTQANWKTAGAALRLKIEIYFNPADWQWSIRLDRDSRNRSNVSAGGRTLPEALRSLADWVEANTEAEQLEQGQ